ncbi:MAG: hypothetical protein Q8S43_04435 [Actinomycetota bacterium]|nr:hypothetical protein [Actinomycetota bacterium]MDP3630185.1 hypothetical protein [Actinomycetota bacterium]
MSGHDARASFSKAREFVAAAHDDQNASRWNAAGLAAVHAGICAGDAITISVLGVRSTSPDHAAVIELLGGVEAFGAPQRRQLVGLLSMKNAVAYEQRLLTKTEAKQLVDQAERFLAWAERATQGPLGESR